MKRKAGDRLIRVGSPLLPATIAFDGARYPSARPTESSACASQGHEGSRRAVLAVEIAPTLIFRSSPCTSSRFRRHTGHLASVSSSPYMWACFARRVPCVDLALKPCGKEFCQVFGTSGSFSCLLSVRARLTGGLRASAPQFLMVEVIAHHVRVLSVIRHRKARTLSVV